MQVNIEMYGIMAADYMSVVGNRITFSFEFLVQDRCHIR